MTLSIKFLLAIGGFALLPLHADVSEPQAEELPVEDRPVQKSSTENSPTEEPPAGEEQETEIVSEHLKMVRRGEESFFVFSRNVKVTTTDMTIFCDRMEVLAGRQDDAAE